MSNRVAGGSRGSLKLQGKLPSDEYAFVKGVAEGQNAYDVGRELGWTDEKVSDMMRHSTTMAGIATFGMLRVQGVMIPQALNVIGQILSGSLEVGKNSLGEQMPSVTVKPETRLAAAQTLLKIAGMDKPRPEDKIDGSDLSELSSGQLHALVNTIQDKIEDKAKEVSAPDSVPTNVIDAEIVDDKPNDYSVLD